MRDVRCGTRNKRKEAIGTRRKARGKKQRKKKKRDEEPEIRDPGTETSNWEKRQRMKIRVQGRTHKRQETRDKR